MVWDDVCKRSRYINSREKATFLIKILLKSLKPIAVTVNPVSQFNDFN